MIFLLAVVVVVFAQDPAQGWTGYAKGVNPTNKDFITHAEAKWKVRERTQSVRLRV
jgi:hypothetical protein